MPAERKDISGEGVRKLASYGCTSEQIANYFGCSKSTIDHKFAQDLRLGKATLQKNILMWQIRRGKVGSDNMLIHLGKVHCGQDAKNTAPESTDQPPATDDDGNTLEP